MVPQREVFEDQGAAGPDPAEEADEDEGDHAGHHRSGRPKVNVDKADGVNRRHSSPNDTAPGICSVIETDPRGSLHAARHTHGDPPGSDRPTRALAESLGGTAHRLNPPRVPRLPPHPEPGCHFLRLPRAYYGAPPSRRAASPNPCSRLRPGRPTYRVGVALLGQEELAVWANSWSRVSRVTRV